MRAAKNKINPIEQLDRADAVESWAQFIRPGGPGFSASIILEALEAGKFIEVRDEKFRGAPVVLLRKSDYEKLRLSGQASPRVKKLLGTIAQATASFRKLDVGHKASSEINAIEAALSLCLDIMQGTGPLYISRKAYLSENAKTDTPEDNDFELPASKSELNES